MLSLSRFEHGFLDALYASEDIGLALVDTDFRYVRINETLAEINGMAASDHEGRTVREVLPGFADALEPLMRRVIETGEALVDLELSGPTPADPNADRHFRGAYYPILEDGSVIGLGALVIEVTQTVRTQRELLAQAHEIYETVVQDLTIAQLAMDEGEYEKGHEALQRALMESKHIASKVLLQEIVPGE